MNNVCLCVGNYAKTPFYVKFLDASLYSMEELCYYFMDKVYLIDDSIVSQELVNWIQTECGLPELAEELEVYVRKRVSAAAFVSTILERTGMYDENTVRKIEHILKEQSSLTLIERYKRQAEYFYRQGRFRQAFVIYSELLEYIPNRDSAGRALMYYNMASIYAMDFAYVQAADFYYESYLLYPDKRTRLAYVLACRRYMTDYAYGAFKRENPEWEKEFVQAEELCAQAEEKWQASRERELLSEWLENKRRGSMEAYYRKAGELIGQLKRDYKKQTQI